MYKLIKIAALSLALFTSACQDIINVEVNKVPDRYVIEANISNNAGGARVMVSTSTPFNSGDYYPGVADAYVVISGEDIAPSTLISTSKGYYIHPSLKGTPNKTYYLTVVVGGKVYRASCKMPPLVNLGDVYTQESNAAGRQQINIYVKFNDPKGLGNCYRIKKFVNNDYSRDIHIYKDDLFDGNTVTQMIIGQNQGLEYKGKGDLKAGDKIQIEFQTISESVYEYWHGIRNDGAQGGTNNAAPSNPKSNIEAEGGEEVLGYFSAHTQQNREVEIK